MHHRPFRRLPPARARARLHAPPAAGLRRFTGYRAQPRGATYQPAVITISTINMLVISSIAHSLPASRLVPSRPVSSVSLPVSFRFVSSRLVPTRPVCDLYYYVHYGGHETSH